MTTVDKRKYKKRSGTSGITGSLYRSQLLSLILSRNLNEETGFVLGCNVDEIGVMSEICFRFYHKNNREKPVAAFINTKYTGHITDDDLTNPKSALNLHKCYESYISIRERFDNNPDALFEGPFDNIEPFFVICTPHQNKIKNHLAEPRNDDKIFTNKINDIIGTGNNKNILKVRAENFITYLINSTIELIGNTIAAYVTSNARHRDEITNDMKKVLKKYHTFLIPHVIKINELDENNSGKFNESLHENSNSHIQLLKKVLFTEILKKSKVVDEEANANIQFLLATNECTVDMLAPLIGSVITFDENSNKLAYMPGVSDCIQKKPLADIKAPKHVIEEAFVVAGMQALASFKINFNDLDIQQIKTKQDVEMEQKMLESVFEKKNQLAEHFLNHLYIYQVKENVGKLLHDEIVKQHAKNKISSNIFQNKPEAVLVSFHHKVQEWMLFMDKPQYLTHSCDFATDTTNIVDPLLSVLNYNCIMELQEYPIKFNSNSFNTFSKLFDTQSRLNIVSNNVLLTSIKVMQYFPGKNCAFINLDNVCNMKDTEFNSLIKELNIATVKTLVVLISETVNDATKTDKFKQLVLSFPNTTLAVTNHYIENFETVNDTINGLTDIDNINDILKHEVTVQGEETELGRIIDEFSTHLIDARILTKIITSKNIKIGKQLSNPYYDKIKDYFIDRSLCGYSSRCDGYSKHFRENNEGERFMDTVVHIKLETGMFDFSNDLIAVFAEPGMGKSTLLTHLSVKTKHAYPKTWIVKMNLLDFCEDFFKWDREETKIDIIQAMHLACRAELNQKESDNLFTIEEGSEGELVLIESKELDPLASLVLKLIIHSYNSKNIIFIFDGFDEICPHYEKTVVQFIKCFTTDIVNNEIENSDSDLLGSWIKFDKATKVYRRKKSIDNRKQLVITCRPYNAILKTIDTEFGVKPLFLTRLSQNEQYRFYISYLETRIKLEELNSEQLKNVDAFFEYLNQFRQNYQYHIGRSRIYRNMLLYRLQEAAVAYFRGRIMASLDNIDRNKLLNRWTSPLNVFPKQIWLKENNYFEQQQLAGIPLHMKIQADLFVNQIKDTSSTKQWDMGVYTFEFYYRFLEIKLKKIRLEEKAGENISTSASLTEYESLLAEVTEEHKKLAFYVFFHNVSSHFKKVLPETQWLNIESIIERISLTEEKTGLIDQVHNGVPRFVHMVFAEYFAVEYIADMLKKEPLTDDEVHQQMDFVVNCLLDSSVGTMTAFNHKLRNDKELKEVLDRDKTKKYIFNLWLEQDRHCEETDDNKSYLKKILANRLIDIAWMLLEGIKDTLNSANVEKFVELISDIFEFTIIIEDLITYVLDAIRRVDPSMVVKALMKCDIQLEDLPDNETILNKLRDKYPGLTLTLKFEDHAQRYWNVLQKEEIVGGVVSYIF